MQKSTSLLLFLFTICAICQNKVHTEKVPNWVQIQDYQTDPEVDSNEITNGSITLLADYQTHIPKQTSYTRFVNKITDNVGIQSNSSISAVYDPTYQKLVFHTIDLIRNGERIDKLDPGNFQVIRRELNADNYLYDGSLTAMINLSDVRRGDIIDLSYSITGFNPIQSDKYGSSYVLTDYSPIGKININIYAAEPLNYKLFSTDLQPKETVIGGLTVYNWNVENPEPFEFEDNIPPWQYIMPTVFVSNTNSWAKVANWATSVFHLDRPVKASLSKKVDEITANQETEGEKIKSILDFVQNEVRYLGLEYGISGYKPHEPSEVLEQRFGDCKDKSLLMVEMLRLLDIEAYPVLISTTLKETITEIPASYNFFDHCVVKVVDENQKAHFYDPTIQNQGGTFDKVHFPDYRYGLVVKKGTESLEKITSHSKNKITTLEEFTVDRIGGSALLEVTTTYTDTDADRMRNFFKNNSLSGISKDYENYYANYYPYIKIEDSPSTEDKIDKNEFIVRESYKVDSIWTPMASMPGNIAMEFTATTILDLLYTDNLESRKHDIYLPYPYSREHVTLVHLPEKWTIINDNDVVSNDHFYYNYKVDYNNFKNDLKLTTDLKLKKGSVSAQEIDAYRQGIRELEETFGYSVFVPDDINGDAFMNSGTFSSFGNILSYVLLVVIIVVGLVLFIMARNNKQNYN
ncbi:MAG: DUF3857 domain-containing protein [Nonlabens sp.]